MSLGDLLGARMLKETYIGFGVSQRSGFFGALHPLGSVNGSSKAVWYLNQS